MQPLSAQSSVASMSSVASNSISAQLTGIDVDHMAKRQRLDTPFYGQTAEIRRFPDAIQKQFASDLCQLLVACNIAWSAVDHPYW